MKPYIYTIIEHQSFGIDEISKTWEREEVAKKAKPSLESSQSPEPKSQVDTGSLKETKERAKKFFEELKDFTKSKDNAGFLEYDVRCELKARNHVGIIQTKSGTLEILPKCFLDVTLQESATGGQLGRSELKREAKQKLQDFFKLEAFGGQWGVEEDKSKPSCQENEMRDGEMEKSERDDEGTRIERKKSEAPKLRDFRLENSPKQASQSFLLHCLKSLKDSPLKQSQISSIGTSYIPLLEIFIKMFCYELFELHKRGVRHDYITTEENRPYLRGKLLFKEQLRHNLIHKERFFTSSDEYSADIPPNRLIQSTLQLLRSKASSHDTLALIHRGMALLEGIPSSTNPQADFLASGHSRHFAHYETLLAWCQIFLERQSFTAFSGQSRAYALLFPMEKLFESYVTHMLKKQNPEHSIKAQDSSCHLLHCKEGQEKLFRLKPDLILKDKNGHTIIADTKWKILKDPKDIAQADLYQVFAYAHHHRASEVWLIYPKPYDTPKSDEKKEVETIIESLKKWNDQGYGYPLSEVPNRIRIKVLFAPLALH